SAEVEPALQLGRRAVRPERDLEAPRHERLLRLRLRPHEGLQVAPEALLELAPLQLGHVHPHAGERLVEAPPHEADGVLDAGRLDALSPELARQAREELV